MLKRKIEQSLTEWKNSANHKPLIIKGCRQCGKPFSVLDFAKKSYKNVVYLNSFENPDYASVFSGSLEIDNREDWNRGIGAASQVAAVFCRDGNFHYYIFSKGGFTTALLEAQKRKEVTLVTLEDLYH